jgi:hypothetical protein
MVDTNDQMNIFTLGPAAALCGGPLSYMGASVQRIETRETRRDHMEHEHTTLEEAGD